MSTLQTQATPSPNALKFSLDGQKLIDAGILVFNSSAEAETNAFANALFGVRGVANVFITPDFATITKHPAADWAELLPSLREAFDDHAQDLA
ncbi:MAG: NifU N-terminal domain-containing protein [Bacteroidota bacterium]